MTTKLVLRGAAVGSARISGEYVQARIDLPDGTALYAVIGARAELVGALSGGRIAAPLPFFPDGLMAVSPAGEILSRGELARAGCDWAAARMSIRGSAPEKRTAPRIFGFSVDDGTAQEIAGALDGRMEEVAVEAVAEEVTEEAVEAVEAVAEEATEEAVEAVAEAVEAADVTEEAAEEIAEAVDVTVEAAEEIAEAADVTVEAAAEVAQAVAEEAAEEIAEPEERRGSVLRVETRTKRGLSDTREAKLTSPDSPFDGALSAYSWIRVDQGRAHYLSGVKQGGSALAVPGSFSLSPPENLAGFEDFAYSRGGVGYWIKTFNY